MLKKDEQLNILDTMLTSGVNAGLLHLTVEDDYLNGRNININGNSVINFGSCSYLGLETDPRLKEGVINATEHFGTQFSSSRTYLSSPLYNELENLLALQFGAPALITPNTATAHIAAIPVLIGEKDAVIMDQMVHASVQTAIQLLYPNKITVELIRHSRMDILEEKIEELRKNHRNIWYFADGIYSMHGDLAPLEKLKELMNKYEQFHIYIDDAHGMGWTGTNGTGTVIDKIGILPKVVISTSLNKSFAAAGGALIFPNEEMKRKVKVCGGPLIFSGPIQPPMLGAAVASSRLHLSPEINILQNNLKKRIEYCNQLIEEYGIPLYSFSDVPIRFIPMGLPKVVFNMANRLLDDGFFTNTAIFPAVPMKKAGVRFTITLHQSHEDIKNLIQAMAKHMPEVMEEEKTSIEDIERIFKIKVPNKSKHLKDINTTINIHTTDNKLSLQHETSISNIPQKEWDRLLGANGSFTWEGLSFLERAFRDNPEPENNWKFHYYIIRDTDNIPVLATFFTEALWKDDMLASEEISRIVEEKRKENPSFLVSKVFAMGSLLTEGEHLYIDRTKDWKKALDLLLKTISMEQENYGANAVVLRDFPADDPDMDDFIMNRGFIKQAMPDSMVVDINWDTQDEYFTKLSYRARRHQKREVLPWLDMFDTEIIKKGGNLPTPEEFKHFYTLYKNVKKHNLELNTFDLPENIFENMLTSPSWEFIVLRLKSNNLPVCIVACFKNIINYAPLIVGLDYNYVESHHLYRVALHTVLSRAKEQKAKKLLWGMGAQLEKYRFGAKARKQCAYVQLHDHYNFNLLDNLKNTRLSSV